jgi:ABC-type uncharacterized transport system permease subunit
MTGLLHFGVLALYGLSAALFAVSFLRSDRRLSKPAGFAIVGGVVLHNAALAAFVAEFRELPLVGLGPCLTAIALLVALGCVFAAFWWRTPAIGLVLAPVAVLLVAAALAVGIRPSGEAIVFRGPWFALHVVFAFAGYAGLTLAFAAGLMYLLQFRELKSKRLGAIFRFFPPLDTLDRLGRRALQFGFPFLSVALIVAWAWTERFGAGAAARNTEVIWGVLSWCVFVAALLARAGGGRRGYRGALASVVGFLVVVVAYMVLRISIEQGGGFL